MNYNMLIEPYKKDELYIKSEIKFFIRQIEYYKKDLKYVEEKIIKEWMAIHKIKECHKEENNSDTIKKILSVIDNLTISHKKLQEKIATWEQRFESTLKEQYEQYKNNKEKCVCHLS